MKYKLKVYSIWEFGNRKDADGNPHQEDCTFPLPNKLKDSDRTFILCDGMGGHDAGEVASATVCQAMGNYILSSSHDAEGVFTDEDLKSAISAAFDALDKEDSGAEKKMGTTLAFLKLHNAGATIAHMGDSRVYHIRPGKDGADTRILFETEDHSLVNDLIKIGELTKEEAQLSKQKNVITRAMQPNMERKPKADINHISDIKAGDYFYMCSDGMLEQPDMENGESLRNIFSNKIDTAKRKVEILTDVTENNRDNHTALIIHIEEIEGIIPEILKKSSTAVPPKRMGIVEDNEDSEEAEPSHTASTLAVEEGTKFASSENNTPSNSLSLEKTIKTNDENESGSSDTSSQTVGTISKTEKLIRNWALFPKTNRNTPKLIARFIIAVIIVAVCVLGLKYISSCSNKQGIDEFEYPHKKKTYVRRASSEGEKRQVRHSSSQNQAQEQSEEVALDAANSDAAQIATGEETSPTSGSPSTSITHVSLSPPAEEIVNSDEQTILNNTKQK